MNMKERETTFPGAGKLAAEMGEGLEYIARKTVIHSSREDDQRQDRTLYLIKTGDGAQKWANLHASLLRLRGIVQGEGETMIIETGNRQDTEMVRKYVEHALWGAGVKACIDTGEVKTRQGRTRDGLVTVKANGKTFAELLKRVKTEVNITETGLTVTGIKKDQNGELRLFVKGGQEKAEVLKDAVKMKIKDHDTTVSQGRMTQIFLMGLDLATTTEDVKKAVADAAAIEETHVEVPRLRVGKYDTQTAMVKLPATAARGLIKKEMIMVGWLKCDVKEKVFPIRCFKCLGFGHVSKECESTVDRSKECLNCGSPGHVAKDCQNMARCSQCNKEGHRADQMTCPAYRKNVESLRKARLSSLAGTGTAGRRRLYTPRGGTRDARSRDGS